MTTLETIKWDGKKSGKEYPKLNDKGELDPITHN